MRHGTPVRARTAYGASRRLAALIGAALLVAAAAAATGCSEPLPTSLLAASPTAAAIAAAEATAETPVPETTDQPAPAAPPAPMAVPVEIGSKRQLFVDDWLVDVATSTTLVLHRPRAAEVVLRLDEPWEGTTAAYFTVFKDGDLYRMYYRCHNDANETTCYAESSRRHTLGEAVAGPVPVRGIDGEQHRLERPRVAQLRAIRRHESRPQARRRVQGPRRPAAHRPRVFRRHQLEEAA